jgi:hypothetical protein
LGVPQDLHIPVLEQFHKPCSDKSVAMTYLKGVVEEIHRYIIHGNALARQGESE